MVYKYATFVAALVLVLPLMLFRPSFISPAATATSRLDQVLQSLGANRLHARFSSTMAPAPDITLYSQATPNGVKASITLEELGIPYKLHPIDIQTNVQKEDWFLKINPNGRIPAITDGEQRVFESGSIMLYLADKYDPERKISYAPGSPEYIEQVSWIMWQMGGLGPMQGQANVFAAFAPVRSDFGIKRYLDETKRLYSVLEIRLQESPYLAGDKYTIADIASIGWVRGGPMMLDIDLSEYPALKKWHDVILEREAVKKGLKIPESKFTDEQFQELLAGMKQKMAARENSDKS